MEFSPTPRRRFTKSLDVWRLQNQKVWMMRVIFACLIIISLNAEAALAKVSWKSGSNGYNASSFAAWRGSPLGLIVGWAPYGDWNSMLGYFRDNNARALKSRSSNVSIGLGLFPTRGGNLADCAAGRYVANHRSIGSRLTANGVGDAEIRLGWEATNKSFPWTAVGKSATQWKACFTKAAEALKAGAPNLRIAWHMAKKGKMKATDIWPDGAPITNIGISHYDDEEARFGMETENGSPVGLRAWLAFAKKKGKKLELAEWGVGRRGDNPDYVAKMHDFFREAGSSLAHEGYLNGNGHELYSPTKHTKSSARYRELF
jgi:hypothetical protein